MARHNREAGGSDQRGYEYTISYQPDWFGHVKVTRVLETGRQSTKILFSNPDPPKRQPGQQVRTAIRSEAQDLGFEISLTDPSGVIRRIVVETDPDGAGTSGSGGGTGVQFTIEPRR